MCGISGLGILFDTRFLLLIIVMHGWLTIVFYQLYLKKLEINFWVKLLALLGFMFLNIALSALWFAQGADGLITDVELFCYEP